MRTIISIFLLCFIVTTSLGQSKKRDRVKRKYRKNEVSTQELPKVFLRGTVYNKNYKPIAGACVTIDGNTKNVNTNEDGEYLIRGLQTGRTRVRVSFIGYETHTADIDLRPGQNLKNVTLLLPQSLITPLLLTSQKKEQQIMDIPTAAFSANAPSIQKLNITNLNELSKLVPGSYFYKQENNAPVFILRGIRSRDKGLGAQSRIATYFNNVPVNRISGASVTLFDMDRIEILKGPQNVMFGEGAEAGAIHYISKMPGNKPGGYITTRTGSYKQKEINGAVNIPIIKDKLLLRTAGIYNNSDGYIRNTYGGKLMGKNFRAGRFSASFRHSWNHKLDLILNYQKDNDPGVAFINDSIPNTEGNIGASSGVASLEQGKALETTRKLFDITLNYRLYMDEHNFWTLIASYQKNKASACWDGDGTALSALEMSDIADSKQSFFEIRGNFLQGAKISGVFGGNFLKKEESGTTKLSTNEEQLEAFVSNSVNINDGAGEITHREETNSRVKNTTCSGFLDLTCLLNRRIFVSGGIRMIYDREKLSYNSALIDSSQTNLKNLYGASPNILYKPVELQDTSNNTLSFAFHLGAKYRYNEYLNLFINYTRGIRPAALHYNSQGKCDERKAETLNSFEAGFKYAFTNRIYFDFSGFYQLYKDFHTPKATQEKHETITDSLYTAGKAAIYGVEANLEAAPIKQLRLFIRYAWLKTQFDSKNNAGEEQKYAQNIFAYSPEHNLTAGFYATLKLTQSVRFFLTPSYSYKSGFFFDDANTKKQKAYGLLNVDCGIKTKKPNLTLSFWAKNITDQQYIVSSGKSGEKFGIKTSAPGAPRMLGGKLTWNFSFKERPYYKQYRH